MGTIYDGRPKVAHKFIGGIESKRCTKCNEWKSLGEFNKKKDMSDGLRNACKPCHRLSNKIYRDKYPDKVKEQAKQKREKFADYYREYSKQWAKDNKHRYQEYAKRRKRLLNSLPYTLTDSQWELVKKQFDHSCAYCGKAGSLEQDHFIPLITDVEYGTSMKNILPACSFCNRSKFNNKFEEWYPMQEFYSVERHHAIIVHLFINKEGGEN
jgi:5-methylcytosine-specific restriction endonuclease McrA